MPSPQGRAVGMGRAWLGLVGQLAMPGMRAGRETHETDKETTNGNKATMPPDP